MHAAPSVLPPDDPFEIEERRLARRNRLRLIGGATALALVLVFGGLFAWPIIDRRIEARNLAKAERLVAERRYRDAWLLLEQTVEANPASFEARRARALLPERRPPGRARRMAPPRPRQQTGRGCRRLGRHGSASLRLDPARGRARRLAPTRDG